MMWRWRAVVLLFGLPPLLSFMTTMALVRWLDIWGVIPGLGVAVVGSAWWGRYVARKGWVFNG